MINTLSKLFAIFSFVLLTGAGIAWPESPSTGNIPEIKKDCGICHADISKGPALKKPLSGLCLDCHPDRSAPREHKVDIVPAVTVRTLPLFDGKMTCATCHDPHSNDYGKMLRMRGKDLCLQCHKF